MTGYAAASRRSPLISVYVSIKSVNHRFLDLHLKLPTELEPMENKIRRQVRDTMTRGHVDVSIVVEREGGVEAHIDRALVSAYLDAYDKLRKEYRLATEADLNTVLKMPGALNFVPAALNEDDAQAMESIVLDTLSEALRSIDQMRSAEAQNIAKELTRRIEAIGSAAAEVEELRKSAEHVYAERLRERLSELVKDSISPERLAQEAALLADRSDVSEELLRMKSHLAQFLDLLAPSSTEAAADAGKRLDFLLQEMNRESNTILSKTSGLGEAGIRITKLGLGVKAEIEKLREQVQNLQ